ncbi:MAG: tetratricopeptide repeat protein [Gammaproteobacteria bacterium]
MNQTRCYLLLMTIAALAISACSIGARKEPPPTIASLNSRTVDISKGAELQVSREQAALSYREFLAEDADPTLRPEAKRRLTDLQFEAAEESDTPTPAVAAQLIRSYEQILADSPGYEANDQVLYQLAKAYEAIEQPENAVATLNRLVTAYPASPYAVEAQFRRGEVSFVNKDYVTSEQAYRAVLEAGNAGDFYERALYKRGWALFKQNRYDKGLDSFMTVLDGRLTDAPDNGLSRLSRADRELINDSLRAISLSFTYEEGAQGVAPYFERFGSRYYEDMIYANLGELYMRKQRYTDAANTWLAFVEQHPNDAQAPLAEMKVIEAYKQGGFPSLVLEAKQEFARRYNLKSPFWQINTPADHPGAVAQLKTNVTDLAQHFHAQAQKTSKGEDYQQAATWYRTFLESFPDDSEAPGQHFLLAEALFESKRFRNAAAEYERTAYQYGPHDKGPEAGYAALLAYNEYEQTASEAEKQQVRAAAIDSTFQFAEKFPQHPQAATVLTRAAEDLFAANDFSRAGRASRQVIEQHPNAEPALRRTAWTVLAHSSFDQGDYLQAESGYAQALNLTAQDDEQRENLVERQAASIYKQGQVSQQAGDLEGAVGHYLRVGASVPNAGIRATAEYDAAATLIEMQRWPRAAQVLEDFRGRYPDNELQGDVTRKLAVAYQNSGQGLKAAGEFERMGQSETDPRLRSEATLQAAELFTESGQSARAAANLQRYVEEFPRPAEPAIEARKQLADIYAEQGDVKTSRRWLSAIVKADTAAGAERSPRTRFLAANATLNLAESPRLAYQQVKLAAPLDSSLALKKERMEAALGAYSRAAGYGIADVATEATFHIGSIYHDFSRALMESERPAELSGEELEQYDLLLEEEAFPFEEQAIEVYEANVKRIADGVYDEWVKKSLGQLAELLPARYAKSERSVAVVDDIR